MRIIVKDKRLIINLFLCVVLLGVLLVRLIKYLYVGGFYVGLGFFDVIMVVFFVVDRGSLGGGFRVDIRVFYVLVLLLYYRLFLFVF